MEVALNARRSDPADRWQWRATRSRPGGEWIDSTAPFKRPRSAERAEGPDPQSDGFLLSSFDLLSGLNVREADEELISEFEQLFQDRAT